MHVCCFTGLFFPSASLSSSLPVFSAPCPLFFLSLQLHCYKQWSHCALLLSRDGERRGKEWGKDWRLMGGDEGSRLKEKWCFRNKERGRRVEGGKQMCVFQCLCAFCGSDAPSCYSAASSLVCSARHDHACGCTFVCTMWIQPWPIWQAVTVWC